MCFHFKSELIPTFSKHAYSCDFRNISKCKKFFNNSFVKWSTFLLCNSEWWWHLVSALETQFFFKVTSHIAVTKACKIVSWKIHHHKVEMSFLKRFTLEKISKIQFLIAWILFEMFFNRFDHSDLIFSWHLN